MVNIPPTFITSSRLSTLEPKDILTILQLTEKKWNRTQIEKRMSLYKETPLVGVGISNPQELDRVVYQDIPVIHIEKECKSLQAVQKKSARNIWFINRLLFVGTASMWGLFGYNILNKRFFKRGSDITQIAVLEKGTIPIPNYMVATFTLSMTCLLSWMTKRLLYNRMRTEYEYNDQEGECILYRNDVIYSKLQYFLRVILPYCGFSLSFYSIMKYKRTG